MTSTDRGWAMGYRHEKSRAIPKKDIYEMWLYHGLPYGLPENAVHSHPFGDMAILVGNMGFWHGPTNLGYPILSQTQNCLNGKSNGNLRKPFVCFHAGAHESTAFCKCNCLRIFPETEWGEKIYVSPSHLVTTTEFVVNRNFTQVTGYNVCVAIPEL